MTTIQELIQLRQQYDAKLKEVGATAVVEELQKIFEALPELESIQWTQFTPYFNDGDPCVFGVTDLALKFKGSSEYRDVWDIAYDKHGDNREALDKLRKQLDEVISPFTEIPSDIFLTTFGDHVEVTVHRSGRVVTEECEHD